MPDQLIVRCVIMLVALAPIWRRLYIARFWACARGTVISLDLRTGPRGGSVWVPTIEFHAAGKRWVYAKNYWQMIGSKPAYKVGDDVELLYQPRKPWRFTYKDNWWNWIGAALGTSMVGLYVIAH